MVIRRYRIFFVDRKIPKFDREQVLILAIGNEVLGYFLVDENSLSNAKVKFAEVSDILRLDADTKTYISVELTVPV